MWERFKLNEIMVHRPLIRAAEKVQCTDIPHDGAPGPKFVFRDQGPPPSHSTPAA